ncbi:collagen alpha-1(I) chain-like [Penaeus vannamei]|uniref:collagen alpha-1(I) chain-like n=1 Tax=Penaeus vannamei TaxID=6689 RepID=UPI00387F8EA8
MKVDHPVVVGAGRLSPHDRGAGADRPPGPGNTTPPTAPSARRPPKTAPHSGTGAACPAGDGAGEAGASSRRRGTPAPAAAASALGPRGRRGRRAQAARPEGEAQPAGDPAPPVQGPRPAPTANSTRGSPPPARSRGGPPVVVGAGPQPHTTAPRAALARPAARGKGPSGIRQGRPSPTPPPGPRGRRSKGESPNQPLPRKTRQTGQTDRQVQHRPAALGPRGRGRVRQGNSRSLAQKPRKTWLNGLAGQAAPPARSLRPGGGTESDHWRSPQQHDQKAVRVAEGLAALDRCPPPPRSLARPGGGTGKDRVTRAAATQQAKGALAAARAPSPLRHPRTAPNRPPIVGGAGPQATRQRQGLPPVRQGGPGGRLGTRRLAKPTPNSHCTSKPYTHCTQHFDVYGRRNDIKLDMAVHADLARNQSRLAPSTKRSIQGLKSQNQLRTQLHEDSPGAGDLADIMRPAPTGPDGELAARRSCRRWSPYSCRRGPSAHTTAGRAARPGGQEGSPSDGPGSQAPPKPAPLSGTGAGEAGLPHGGGGTPAPPPPPPSAREGAGGRRAQAARPEGEAQPAWGPRTARARPRPAPTANSTRGSPPAARSRGSPPVVVGAGPQPHTTAPRARLARPAGRATPRRGAAGPRPNPTPPPSAREGAGPMGKPEPTPVLRKTGRQARPGQGPPPSAREGAGAEGAGKAQAVPWPPGRARRAYGCGHARPPPLARPGGARGKDRPGDTRGRRTSRPRAARGSGGLAPRPPGSRPPPATRTHASPYSWRRRPVSNTTETGPSSVRQERSLAGVGDRRPPHAAARSGQAAARKDRVGDARPPPQQARAALGPGPALPAPLRNPRTRTQPPLPMLAQAAAHDQRQGLHPSAGAAWPGCSRRSFALRNARLHRVSPVKKSNYERFNRNNFNIPVELNAGWHQTPPLILDKDLSVHPCRPVGARNSIFVTTSPCREWIICAPAAFLDVVAVSQAPSPESNPDSPLPVIATVGV